MLEGALHLLEQPMALLVIVATVLATDGLRGGAAAMTGGLVVFAVGLGAGSALEPAQWQSGAAAVSLALAGLAAAAALVPGPWAGVAASGAAGIAVSLGATLTVASFAEVAGAGALACLLLLGATAAWRQWRTRWPSVGVWAVLPRVIGAWLAAIGMLVLALQLSGQGA